MDGSSASGEGLPGAVLENVAVSIGQTHLKILNLIWHDIAKTGIFFLVDIF